MIKSKEEERKALDKISKIIEDLGVGSYLSYAFDGCIELAHQNIREDAAYSFSDQIEDLTRQLTDTESKLGMALNREKMLVEDASRYEKACTAWESKYYNMCDEAVKGADANQKAQERIEELELEVCKLKAKLYDFMVKEEM